MYTFTAGMDFSHPKCYIKVSTQSEEESHFEHNGLLHYTNGAFLAFLINSLTDIQFLGQNTNSRLIKIS